MKRSIKEVVEKTKELREFYYIFIIKKMHIIREAMDRFIDPVPIAKYGRISKRTVRKLYDMLKSEERTIEIAQIPTEEIILKRNINTFSISKTASNLFDIDFGTDSFSAIDMIISTLIIAPKEEIQFREAIIPLNVYSEYISERDLFRYGDRFSIIVPMIGTGKGFRYITMKYNNLSAKHRIRYMRKIYTGILEALSSDKAQKHMKRVEDIFNYFVKVYSYMLTCPLVILLPKDKRRRKIRIL